MTEVVLMGGGGHAKVVIDCLRAQGVGVACILDENKTGELFGIPFVKDLDDSMGRPIIIAVGDNATRRRLAGIKSAYATAIHPSSMIGYQSSIGEGSMILHGVIIQPMTKLGKHVIANTACRIDHDCIIGDFAHIAPGAVLCGGVTVGEGTLVGAGAVVLPSITIGPWSVVGSGAVVTANVPGGVVVAGNPARIKSELPK